MTGDDSDPRRERPAAKRPPEFGLSDEAREDLMNDRFPVGVSQDVSHRPLHDRKAFPVAALENVGVSAVELAQPIFIRASAAPRGGGMPGEACRERHGFLQRLVASKWTNWPCIFFF